MPLDAKAVEQKGRELAKATDASSDPSILLNILSALRTGVIASESLLRSTKIGVIVNKLKQHPNPQVKKQAGDLVAKWRNDVQRLKVGGSSSSGLSTPTGGKASPAPSASPKGKRPDVPKDKRNSKTDGVKWQVTGNDTRDNCIKLMYDGLAFMSDDLPDHILSTARSIEAAVFAAHSPETSSPYKSRIRSLYQNLRSKTNTSLRARVLSGAISPTTLVGMSPEDMKSEERREEEKKMMKENMDKAMVAQEDRSISTHLTCGKCGQKKVTYTQAQTRSADEPMTTFCTCLNCGNRWKFS